MYLKCVTEKTAHQQSCLEAALIELMKDVDFEKISVVDICEKAGITRRIFYRLFETKQDCLLAAIDHKIVEAELYRSKLGYNGFCQILEYVKEQKDFFSALRKSNQMGLYMERVLDNLNRENVHAKHLMGIYGSDDNELLVFNISGFIGMMFYWIDTDFECSIEHMAKILSMLMRVPADKTEE